MIENKANMWMEERRKRVESLKEVDFYTAWTKIKMENESVFIDIE